MIKNLQQVNSSINKRRSNRLPCLVPVEGKNGSPFDHIQTIDFSKGGIGFVSEHKIPIGKEIAVEIQLGPEEEPVIVLGEVRWVRHVKDSDVYRLGMYFKEIISGSKAKLEKFFKKQKGG
ncbi:MAG: PilZ domain-containing protein [Candidatus Omnitrophica bacterium]|nr:PilZ domain-containing protein [Candidatus Omnitrophota bacterium]